MAGMCEAFAAQADVGFVRLRHGAGACGATRELRPTVVGFSHSLSTDDKVAIAKAARDVGARAIELPPFAPTMWAAQKLVRVATSETIAATG